MEREAKTNRELLKSGEVDSALKPESSLNFGPAELREAAPNTPYWFVQQGIVYLQEVATWFRKEGKSSLAQSCDNYADHLRECKPSTAPSTSAEELAPSGPSALHKLAARCDELAHTLYTQEKTREGDEANGIAEALYGLDQVAAPSASARELAEQWLCGTLNWCSPIKHVEDIGVAESLAALLTFHSRERDTALRELVAKWRAYSLPNPCEECLEMCADELETALAAREGIK
jgi:hypothetical protein